MNDFATRTHRFHFVLVAASAIALTACSKTDAGLAAAATPPVAVAVAPTGSPAPVAAQANGGYEQGRRDQQRHDQERAARDSDPRAGRDEQGAPRPLGVAATGCRECGVVESISAVKIQGETNGVGAVAGGVGGAVIGNRIAGRNDKTIGGIVGAVGGGLIGNAIEKHERTTTVYDVNVRMSDGRLRTVRQAASPALGDRVRVDADGLHSAG